MSEYQYYEFRAVDRPLTNREMASLAAISSRARITSISFVNTYNYGNFRGDPKALMAKYFDAFVYVANWGTHELVLRLPKKSLGSRDYAPFCTHRCLRAWIERQHLLLSFRSEELRTDWEEGEGWLDSLLPLRADLLRGDLRSLYLGWLFAVQHGEVDDGRPEPPIPAGLRSLSEPLKSPDLLTYPLREMSGFRWRGIDLSGERGQAAGRGRPARSAAADGWRSAS